MITSLGLCASLAAVTSGMLVPSTVSLGSIKNSEVGTTGLIDPYSQLMKVPCLGCMYAQPLDEGEGFVWTEGVENALLLNISVGSDPTTLLLNDVQIYPPLHSSTPALPFVAQVPAAISLVDIRENPSRYTTRPLRLTRGSFSASAFQAESGEAVVDLIVLLQSLEQQTIDVPEISVRVLQDAEGNLVILQAEAAVIDGAPTDGPQKECTHWPLLCKWRAIIADRLAALEAQSMRLPCSKGRKMNHRPSILAGAVKDANSQTGHERHPHGGPARKLPGHRRPHLGQHGRQHHKHHKHHKLHRILRAVGRIMLTVFVPILIGVAAGMVLYLLGYLIGATLAFVFTRLLGFRRATGYQAIALEEDDAKMEVDEALYDDDEQPRPSREKVLYVIEEPADAPPKYVEVEATEVREQRK